MKRLTLLFSAVGLLLLLTNCNSGSDHAGKPQASASPTAQATAAAPPADPASVAVAEKMVGALGRGDLAAATADFDATMRFVLPPDKLKTTWAELTSKSGAFQKQLNTRSEKGPKNDMVFVNCHFANEDLALEVTVTSEGKVSGFFVRPKF